MPPLSASSAPRNVRVLPAVVLPGRCRPGGVRAGGAGTGQARAPRGSQAHRSGPGLGRTAAGGRSRPETRRPGRVHRRGVRGARAPPLHRTSACPPAGALQKPLTCPPPSTGRRRTRPCPCDLHLAPRLLNQARHLRAGMPARLVFPAAGWTPATSNCVMPPCTHARARSRSGSACSPARASSPGGGSWPTWPAAPARTPRRRR